ncbi:MAG: AMP-binding protein, partial [Deltaproteobacteria bacterium]|nr:AMP-binding protein [Deltaproteobacteria bacterium]
MERREATAAAEAASVSAKAPGTRKHAPLIKAGAAYVPLDPSYPGERLRHIFTESEATVLLTESSLASKAREHFEGIVLELDTQAHAIAANPTTRLTREQTGVRPNDVCYVIYTSGTTGRPKGVTAEHRHVVKFAAAFNKICGTTPDDRVYQGFSLTFDGSVEELWMAFSNGSALVVGDAETPRFGDELAAYLESRGVTYFSTVPTLLATFTRDVATLKTVVLSGEICPAELVARRARAGLRIFNVYGPTEATVNTTALECVPGRAITIGRPLEGYGIHIVDERSEE